jgi:hypothetical protein
MAVYHYSYLFDNVKCVEEISFLIPELEAGNHHSLFNLAKQTLEATPEGWEILYDLFLANTFEEDAEDPDISTLLMKALVRYLKRVDQVSFSEWRLLQLTLPLIGWSREDTDLLTSGKTICELLVPSKKYNPKDYVDNPQDRPWCSVPLGWLDNASINQLYPRFVESEQAYLSIAKSPPESIQKEFFHKDLPPNWLSERIVVSYKYMLHVLNVAVREKKSLATGMA